MSLLSAAAINRFMCYRFTFRARDIVEVDKEIKCRDFTMFSVSLYSSIGMEGAARRSLIILVLVKFVVSAEAVKCFQCNSDYDQDCMSLNRTFSNKYMVDCERRHHKKYGDLKATFCFKFHHKSEKFLN